MILPFQLRLGHVLGSGWRGRFLKIRLTFDVVLDNFAFGLEYKERYSEGARQVKILVW